MNRLVARLILVLLAGAAGQVLTAGLLQAQQGVPVREGVPDRAGTASDEGVAVQAPQGVPDRAGTASDEGVAVQAPRGELAPAEADPEQLTDEQVRDLLSQQTLDRWTRWKKNRGIRGSRANRTCNDYNDGQGPKKPQQVWCTPDDVPAETVQEYRQRQRHLRSTFLTEPTPAFLTQPTPRF